jgi:hypothetical protein
LHSRLPSFGLKKTGSTLGASKHFHPFRNGGLFIAIRLVFFKNQHNRSFEHERGRKRPTTTSQIARKMNIPEGTVLARAKREGWPREIQSANALAKREGASPALTPVQAVAASMQQRGERHLERMAGVTERGVDHIETMDGPEILSSVDQIEKLDKVARRTFGLNDNPFPAGFTLNVLNLWSMGA